jgi:hypothetical protein
VRKTRARSAQRARFAGDPQAGLATPLIAFSGFRQRPFLVTEGLAVAQEAKLLARNRKNALRPFCKRQSRSLVVAC